MTNAQRVALTAVIAVLLGTFTPWAAPGPPPAASEPGDSAVAEWVQRSNQHAQVLLQVLAKYSPEAASRFGVTGFDEQVIDLRPGFSERSRADLEEAANRLKADLGREKDPLVRQDLEIMIDAAGRAISRQEIELKHIVPSFDLAQIVFFGTRSLLDDQVGAERRPAALVRLRRYAGLEPGTQPIVDLAEAYMRERMAQPGLMGPYKGEIEKNLAQSQYFVDGVAKLFTKYAIKDYEPAFAKLKEQLAGYDDFVRKEILPRARTDFRLPTEVYRVRLRDVGIDAPPEQLAAMGHEAFADIQKQMQALAPEIAAASGATGSDCRDVIRLLKKNQVEGDATLDLYRNRIASIEKIIRDRHLVTLPARPMIFRFATEAESAATPAPHMDIPQLLNNTGQRGAFVLPLKIPAAAGQTGEQKFDDFNFDAASWTLTAHEGRPGHELQFDSMIERGVSIARAVFAMNSTNAEGWGLYSEWILFPYMPADGKLISLQHRLMRAARAFLDPELQMGKVTPEQARTILTREVVLSDAMANEEVERYMFWAPGQAPSYYFGFTQLRSMRQEAEKALGARFDQQKFHDFVLGQGLLPPDLLRKAVVERFIPQAKASTF